MHLNRRAFVAAVGAVALAGCSEQGGNTEDTEGADPASGDETATTAPPAEGSVAKERPVGTTDDSGETPVGGTETTTEGDGMATPRGTPGEFGETPPVRSDLLPLPMERKDLRWEARSGGPSKDGIPSIDVPKFIGADQASLADGDIVFGLEHNGETKAYPQHILVWHEIVNDTVGEENVSVTYCPLTGTVQGFERGETTFGVSGRLINNNLVMYDRNYEIWWPQILASSIPGSWNESPAPGSLQEFRVVWTTWEQWRSLHPDTSVLSEDTGHVRNYGGDPYGAYNPKSGYYSQPSTLFPVLNSDDTIGNKRVVMGARTPRGAAAFLKDSLREAEVMTGEIGADPVVAIYDARLDTGYVYRNPEEKAVSVDGEKATVDGAVQDPDDLSLERIHTFDAMWFAWHGFYPETNVYQ